MDGTTAYERAKKHVEDVEGFYIHLSIYVLVITALVLIDLTTGGGLWSLWPAAFWGIAVGIHALAVFVFEGRFAGQWKERKIREYMEQDRTAGHA